MRVRALAAAAVLAFGAAGVPAALNTQPAPDLESALRAAAKYLAQYERDVTAVIAQEDYVAESPERSAESGASAPTF